MKKINIETIETFYALVRAGLWEKDVQLSCYNPIDYKEVYRLAEEQAVVGIVTAGLEHVSDVTIPKEVVLQFVGSTFQLEQRNKAMNGFIAELIESLRKEDIYTLLVKGQGVAQCYERPLWRASGDVDLFLSDDNYQKAKVFLLPLSSSSEPEYPTSKHLGMTIETWVVELHGLLRCSLSSRLNHELEQIRKDTFYRGNVRSWFNNGTQVFMLSAENDVIYSFIHYLNHFYKGGIGLRQICDWSRLLWSYKDNINFFSLETRIRKIRLTSEWRAFGTFAVEYLGMPADAMPLYSPGRKWSRKAARISSFIIEVGNFGHNRDMSYYNKYPYAIRKLISFGRRCKDLARHVMIFPMGSIRFFPSILYNGLRSAIKGE